MKYGHYILNTLVGLTAIFSSSMVFADDITCPPNTTSSLYKGNPEGRVTVNTAKFGSVWGAVGTTTIQSYSLVDCTSLIINGITRSETYRGNSAQIDISQTHSYGGKTYYKLRNTSSEFINKYAYITFRYGESFGREIELPNAFPEDKWYENATGVAASPSQGLMVYDLDFIYTAAPTQTERAEIHLGTLAAKYLSTDAPGDSFFREEDAYIALSLIPEPSHTCDFDIPPVDMNTMLLSQFGEAGSEMGNTRFIVKVNCDSGLAGELLHYWMEDTTQPDNRTDVLTNSEIETSNVGIKIYEYDNQRPVFFNTEYEFGRLSGGSRPTASKAFTAKYYRINSTPLKAGAVSAQAMINVIYK